MEIIKDYKGPVRMPIALTQFRCIGPRCPDSCCKGWEVEVDQETFGTYQNLKDHATLPQRLAQDVMKNPHCSDPAVDYALMRLTPQYNCPFLAQSLWCDLQSAGGEALLSVTCHLFPRTYARIDGILEMSMTLSCPVVAEAVLAYPGTMTFDASQHHQARVLLSQDIQQDSSLLKDHPAQALLALRELTLDLLAQDQVSLWQRLAHLNSFHIDLMPLHVPQGVSKIKPLIGRYRKQWEKAWSKPTGMKEKMGYRKLGEMPMRVLEHLHREMPQFFQLGEGVIRQVQETLVDTLIVRGSQLERTRRYERLLDRWVLPFSRQHGRFFEHYLRHFVFKYHYPFSEAGDPYTANALLVLRLYLTLLHLAIRGEMEGKLTLAAATEVIQQLTKLWDHNRQFFERAGACMMQEGFDGPDELLSLVPRNLGV